MKKISYFVILISIFFFSACKKTTKESSGGLTCRMLQSSNSIQNRFFFYDDNRNIIKVLFVDAAADTEQDNYYYVNGHVAYMIRLYQGTLGDTISYTYNSGKYVEVNQYGFKLKYLYNGAGQIVKIENYEGSKLSDYSDYSYDIHGNCTRCIDYSWSDSTYFPYKITDFEFGDQKNQYPSIGLPPLNSMGAMTAWFFSPNNITRMRMQSLGQSNKVVFVYHYSSFNENGYPLEISTTDSLNNVFTIEYIQYICP